MLRHARKEAAGLRQKRPGRALLDEAAAVEHQHPVAVEHGAEAVGDDEGGAALELAANGALNQRVRRVVHLPTVVLWYGQWGKYGEGIYMKGGYIKGWQLRASSWYPEGLGFGEVFLLACPCGTVAQVFAPKSRLLTFGAKPV